MATYPQFAVAGLAGRGGCENWGLPDHVSEWRRDAFDADPATYCFEIAIADFPRNSQKWLDHADTAGVERVSAWVCLKLSITDINRVVESEKD